MLDLLRAHVRVAFDDLLDLLPELLAARGRVHVLQDEVAQVRRGEVRCRCEDRVVVVAAFLKLEVIRI